MGIVKVDFTANKQITLSCKGEHNKVDSGSATETGHSKCSEVKNVTIEI